MNILAYLDRWTAAASDTLDLMVSSRVPLAAIELVRIEGPGDATPVAAEIEPLGSIKVQEAVTGSHIVVDGAGVLALDTFTFTAWILPTRPRSVHRQVIASHRSAAAGWAIFLDHDGRLAVEVAGTEGIVALRCDTPLAPEWQIVGLAIDASTGSATLFHGPSDDALAGRTMRGLHYRAPQPEAALMFGAPHGDASRAGGDGAFNGKLAQPRICRDAATPVGGGFRLPDRPSVVASWDFSATGTPGLRLVNAPRMLLPGARWRPRARFPEERPLWDAIGLNEDAVDDLGWAPSFRIRLPPALSSGVYAVRLRAAAGEDETEVPFFVRPGMRRSQVAVLLPTFTYLAYANHRYASEAAFMGEYAAVSDRPVTLGPIDQFLAARPPVGPSIYDQHHDGSAVVTSSLRRPVPHMQSHYRWWMTSAPRHFGADLELLGWLKAQAIDYDLLTDHDLDADGNLLDGYAAVLTGSHPEYVSAGELDALALHVEAGGSLAYLGGNGFYWVTERPAAAPHRIEVRRRANGRGGWEMPPGEHLLSSGTEGGLWADLGRPPERLTGVSLAGQGWKASVRYRRMPGADDPRAVSLFDGVDTIFGSGGIGGGAVGDEWDALVPGEEDNPNVILLARSLPVAPGFLPGERDDLGAWCDMVLKYHGSNGGRVFSASSIGFLSALPRDRDLAAILIRLLQDAMDREG